MPTSHLRCDKCQTILSGPVLNAPEPLPCPGCRAPLLTRVFPAFFRVEPIGQRAEAVGSDEEASCFFHARKKAVASCVECGRFICALCDLELSGRHLCPSCVQDNPRARRGGVGELENQRVRHDRIALLLGAWPLFPPLWVFSVVLWVVLLFTGPATLYMVGRYWQEPAKGLVPRSQWRMVLAAILGLAQLLGGLAVIYFFFIAG